MSSNSLDLATIAYCPCWVVTELIPKTWQKASPQAKAVVISAALTAILLVGAILAVTSHMSVPVAIGLRIGLMISVAITTVLYGGLRDEQNK